MICGGAPGITELSSFGVLSALINPRDKVVRNPPWPAETNTDDVHIHPLAFHGRRLITCVLFAHQVIGLEMMHQRRLYRSPSGRFSAANSAYALKKM